MLWGVVLPEMADDEMLRSRMFFETYYTSSTRRHNLLYSRLGL